MKTFLLPICSNSFFFLEISSIWRKFSIQFSKLEKLKISHFDEISVTKLLLWCHLVWQNISLIFIMSNLSNRLSEVSLFGFIQHQRVVTKICKSWPRLLKNCTTVARWKRDDRDDVFRKTCMKRRRGRRGIFWDKRFLPRGSWQ